MFRLAKCITALFGLAIVWGQFGFGAVKILGNEEDLEQKKSYKTVLYLVPDAMRGDREGPDEHISFVFRADKNVAYFIDHRNKTYRVMTQQEVEKLKARMEEAYRKMEQQLALMEQQMKNMPPQQQEMVKKMIEKARQHQQGGPQIVYRRVKQGDRVAGYGCDVYEGFIREQKVESVCAALPESLGLESADFQVIEKAQAYFAQITKRLGNFFAIDLSTEWEAGKQSTQYPGIPLRTITYRNGKVVARSEVTGIEKSQIAMAMFDPPAGYRKVALMPDRPAGQPQQ